MDWKYWKPWYDKIISDFGYDPQKDLDSSIALNDFLRNRVEKNDFENLKKLIKGNIIFIYECGPSLPDHLKLLTRSSLSLQNFTHISADGATSALLEYNIIPNIVVTDLDGDISDLIRSNKEGSITLIHAHGDNLDKIRQHFSSFPGKVMGTTQNKPLSLVKNYGGFTDGDRCIYLAEAMEASKIILFGFDFGNIIGKFSKPYLEKDEEGSEIKLKKLHWAEILIQELSTISETSIFLINSIKPKLGNVKNYTFEDLLNLLKP